MPGRRLFSIFWLLGMFVAFVGAVAALVGGLLGALVALLLAPRPGSETQTLLAEKGREWQTRAQEVIAAAQRALAQLGREAQKALSRTEPAPQEGLERPGG